MRSEACGLRRPATRNLVIASIAGYSKRKNGAGLMRSGKAVVAGVAIPDHCIQDISRVVDFMDFQ
jgi:hypothetical protein